MKSTINHLNQRVVAPLKNWVNRLIQRRRDDDDHFNHPFAVF